MRIHKYGGGCTVFLTWIDLSFIYAEYVEW